MKWFKCCHCGKVKSEINFYRDRHKRSGYKPRCKDCEKLYKNKELRRQYEKEYRQKYPQKRALILSNYYKKNKKKFKSSQDRYRKTDQFKINHKKHGATRRAREAGAFFEEVDYKKVYLEEGGKCFYCGKKLSFSDAEFDHYIPISKNGLHKRDNIRCSCMYCNRSKGAKMPEGEVCHQMV